MQTASILTRRSSLGCVAGVLVAAAVLAGCGNKQTGEAKSAPPPSAIVRSTNQPAIQTQAQAQTQAIATQFVFGPLIESNVDLSAGPVEVPLDLEIPALKVDAPVVGVGLTSDNLMDSPKGPLRDPIWSTAFWYRGGSVPGNVGVATISGHVNDPLGQPMIFARLQDLHPGDLIIVHLRNTTIDIRFKVDETAVYSLQQSSDPAVLTRIFGAGPVAGAAPQPSPDGLSHLTLVTCAGYIKNGEFDHHAVVYATRSN